MLTKFSPRAKYTPFIWSWIWLWQELYRR